ncbi:non-hydrolyzing UDP-N-acetylglucosamine 2-epimerase [Sapientia aquatica]|uniref:UDP-N-acetylglucosamine 2-epimerase (non-hydrolyzing) n=1 Tax=Sapientia aquatica TaxID=1549640 RepID=A0A4R5W2U7_9BURK|nr:UDP-N-acetylglucosamine 2-epimerase (non-hydrolyzing) [Sapientia aquatica]TDK67054.1 UDP-N-acetylglucosamine 2-epimerase (non-hydrolyzing) [Sapientia aquatica]
MKNQVYLACIGTRPEIIKMAPIYHELKARGDQILLVHTGQHEAIAEALYDFFDMPPDINVVLKRKSTSLAHLTSALLDAVDDAMQELKPDVILVQGDTTSAMVGSLIAYYYGKPVAHVEAGLRTHEHEPFPEEKNRELIGRLAHWHFSPTKQASNNLLQEGIDASRIFDVGNTVIDAALWTRQRIMQNNGERSAAMPANLQQFELDFPDERLILVTAHRRENWGQPIRNIAKAIGLVLSQHEDVVAVWPVHPNPAVRTDIEAELKKLPLDVRQRICLTESLGYQTLIALLMRCDFTLTDSGGIQEEASAFGKPVLIARTSTERQELVDNGGALLVGTDVANIVAHIDLLLENQAHYDSMKLDKSPFGDGNSAQRIVDILSNKTLLQEQAYV